MSDGTTCSFFSCDIVRFSTDVLSVTLACPVILIHPLQRRCYYNWGSMVYLQQYCEMSLNMRLTVELIFIRLKRSELLHLGIWFKAIAYYCEPTTCRFVPTRIDNHSRFLYCEYQHLMIYVNFCICIALHQNVKAVLRVSFVLEMLVAVGLNSWLVRKRKHYRKESLVNRSQKLFSEIMRKLYPV